MLGLHLTEAGRRELFAAKGVDESPSRPPRESVADGLASPAVVSLTGAGPSDGEQEGSTNRLDGEREIAEVLEPAEVGAMAPGRDTGP